MLAITRIGEIRDMVQRKKSVMVSDLAEYFSVTEETIRRDLKKLESEGVLTRVYGGAYSIDGVQNDVNVSIRQAIFLEEKKRIATSALKFINNGDSIFLDSSTTALQLAQMLTLHTLTVITNSLKVAELLADSSGITLILTGGTLHKTSMSLLGQIANRTLSGYYSDKAFVSCRSLSMQNGITDSNEEQGALRRIAIERSDAAYLLVDHTKFGATSFSHIADISSLRGLITDVPVDEEWREFLLSRKVTLIES